MNPNNVVCKQRFVWSLTKHQNPPILTGMTSKNVSQVDTRYHQTRFNINKRKRIVLCYKIHFRADKGLFVIVSILNE